MDRRKTEVENQKKLIDERDKKIAAIDHQMATLRDESTQYKIQWEQAKGRNAILQSQFEQQARDNERMRQQLGTRCVARRRPSAPGSSSYAPAARITDLRGTIQQVSGDLATITPGSDAGVTVGAKLRVFRLQPQPEYLGELIIRAVTPTQAVGQLTGPRAKQVHAGDEVDANGIARTKD